MMVAPPLPYAVATPAVAPTGCAALSFELTGKTSGAEERQVTELVRSLTYGAAEKVPNARKFPVSCKFPTVIEFGMMVSESRGSGAAVSDTATVALFETTLPSAFVNSAEIVVLPELEPVTSPAAFTEAMDGALELHLILVELVTSCCRPVLPDVPSAISWLV
jgi:hypothetical protein